MTRITQCIAVIAILSGSVAAQADTTFTYQGELKESGEPADGAFDMDFALWNALSGGSQVGSTIQVDDQPVSEGLFTVELDFGAEVFDGSQRWLEITVEGTTLAPRQPITHAPYSIQTRGIFVDDDGNVGIGTLTPAAPLEVHNANTGQIMRLESDRTYGYVRFREGATTRAYLGYGDEGDLLVNALPDSFAIDGTSTALHFAVDSDATRGITIDTNGNVGIGTTTVDSDLTSLHVLNAVPDGPATAVRGEVTYDGYAYNLGGHFISASSNGQGVRGEASGSDGKGVSGYASGINGSGVRGTAAGTHGWGVEGIAYGSNGWGINGYANGGPDAIAIRGYGFNTWDFYAAGPGGHYGEVSSIRWKRNIRNIDEPLDKMARLRGVYFDWDAEHGGQHDLGMIAEEVGEVLPEVVQYEENGVYANGMDYGKLTPLLVEAVNALRAEKDAEIDALRAEKDAEIAELRQRMSDLRHVIEQVTVEVREERQ
jgi:hypothetical protein